MSKVLMEIKVPKLFPAYAADLGVLEKWGMWHLVQHYCDVCGQDFTVKWGKSHGLNPHPRGGAFSCPYCRTAFVRNREVAVAKPGTYITNALNLKVVEYKTAVEMTVDYEELSFHDTFHNHWRSGRETYQFDVAKGVTEYRRLIRQSSVKGEAGKEVKAQFGDLFNSESIFSESPLRWVDSKSILRRERGDELKALLRTIRDTVGQKLAERDGRRYKPANVRRHNVGFVLEDLANIAYRLTFPEASNFDDFATRTVGLEGYRANNPAFENWMARAGALTAAGRDIITAAIDALGLPNKTSVRRIVKDSPRSLGRLRLAFDLCQNYDLAVTTAVKSDLCRPETTLPFLRNAILPLYGEKGVAQAMSRAEKYQLEDAAVSYSNLTDENRNRFAQARLPLADMHDWLAITYSQQGHKNFGLNVPEHILKRLAMQKDAMKFYLPKESTELLAAGHHLHNCVLNYAEGMAEGKEYIVLISADSGKLTGALRVRDNTLVEAKANYNKTVGKYPELRKAVLEWADKAGLKLDTRDLDEPKEAPHKVPDAVRCCGHQMVGVA